MNIKLDMLGIVAEDFAASFRFYRLLGLAVPESMVGEQHAEVTLPNGLRVAWDSAELIRGLYPDLPEPQGQRISIAFLCDTPADVDALHAQIVAAGFESYKAPWDAVWGQRYAVVTDPDGNHVDLFAALPSAGA